MQVDQLDNLIMEALADMNKAPVNMERHQLDEIISDWSKYSELVSWAASELQCVAQTEEAVNCVKTPEDLPDFQMEFSGLLKELGCPYGSIMEQPLGSRFDSNEKRKVLLNFLLTELEAARILHAHCSKPKQLKVELDESSTAKVLREIIMELGLGKPPESITTAALWNNIAGKVANLLKSGALDPLFEGFLSPNQWSQIEKYFGELTADYQKRREMLLKRLDVTVQSFHWSDRLRGKKEKEINEEFQKYRPLLTSTPNVNISDIMASRIDLPIVEKTAAASVRKNTKSAVNNVVIGRVPDRGGRTDEIQPPPPEMPPWQQRQGGAPAGTSGWIQSGQQQSRGGGNRGGGGRVQGGWSDSGHRGGQHQGGGGRYQGGGGGQYQSGGGGQYQGGGGGQYQGGGGGQYQGGGGGQYQGGGGRSGWSESGHRDGGGQYQGSGGGHYQGSGGGHHQGGGGRSGWSDSGQRGGGGQYNHGGGGGHYQGGRDQYQDNGGGQYQGGGGGRGHYQGGGRRQQNNRY